MKRRLAIFFHNLSVLLGYKIVRVNGIKVCLTQNNLHGQNSTFTSGFSVDFSKVVEKMKWNKYTHSFYFRVRDDLTLEYTMCQLEKEETDKLDFICTYMNDSENGVKKWK